MKIGIQTTSLNTLIAQRYFAKLEEAVAYAQNTSGVCYKEHNIGKIAKHPFLATAWVEQVEGAFELNVECADFDLAHRIDADRQASAKAMVESLIPSEDSEKHEDYCFFIEGFNCYAFKYTDEYVVAFRKDFRNQMHNMGIWGLEDFAKLKAGVLEVIEKSKSIK